MGSTPIAGIIKEPLRGLFYYAVSDGGRTAREEHCAFGNAEA